MDPNISQALKFIRQVQTTIAGDGRLTYDQFRKTLNQYRLGKIDSSTVISTLQALFHNHQTLIDAFTPFLPRHRPPAEDPKLRTCLDFLNRVGTRFDGGRAYHRFLDCMRAYSRAEITASDLRAKVLGLFGKNDDLLDEFLRFFPEPTKRRRIDLGGDAELRRPERTGSREDAPRRTERRRMKKSEVEEKAAARRVRDRDNFMEDWLCEVDVGIGNVESCRRKAMSIYEGLYAGRLSPADVREQFTPLNLACIRDLDGDFLQYVGAGQKLVKLVEALMKKKKELEREREKVVQKWNRIRQTKT